jgi:hypothetical protein
MQAILFNDARSGELMITPDFNALIFIDGVAFEDETIGFIAFPHRPGRTREASGTLVLWFDHGAWADGGFLPIAGVGLASLASAGKVIAVLGRDGEVAIVSDRGGIVMESLPGALGPLRGIRNVHRACLAFGMNREIFRRSAAGAWVRWDVGIPKPPENQTLPLSARLRLGMNSVGGITAIDADVAGRCAAVGFRGEIYEWVADRWQPVGSPTNVILKDIRSAAGTGLYVCGQNGIVLHSATSNVWTIVEHDAPASANFESLCVFREMLFLADGRCLRKLTDGRCSIQTMGVADGYPPSSRLAVSGNQLLSIAGREVYRTRDGLSWETILN